ncbi:MAG: STAS domain-containing protein [Planctomycetaceae bacterium]|nr:STAS domain-containing protein [Planctomycetaceae bacterium]
MSEFCVIELSGSVGVCSVRELHRSACAAVREGQSVEFNLAEVTDIDSSLLQLFLAAQKACASNETNLKLSNISAGLKQKMGETGVDLLATVPQESAG